VTGILERVPIEMLSAYISGLCVKIWTKELYYKK
jgi:hypothetical protein